MTIARPMALLSLVAAGVLLLACGSEGGETSSDRSGEAKSPQTVAVVMKDNVFEPKALTVAAGQTVTFSLKNEGANLHNMHVVSDDVDPKNAMSTPIEGGKTDQLVVKFAKKGTFKFQCDLHTPDMAGTITVQ